MKNKLDIDDIRTISTPDPQKKLTQDEINILVKKNFEFLKWLINYSKTKNLQLKQWDLDTFACGLWEDIQEYADKYLKWQIKFEDIPLSILQPKYIYYPLEWLISENMKILKPVLDHELQHAESSDYGDIIQTTKRAIENNLPSKAVGRFFNGANEDPYIGNKQIKKSKFHEKWVLDLYLQKWFQQTHWQINMSNQNNNTPKYIPKWQQLETKMMAYWLHTRFPDTYNVDVLVDEDVQKYFDNILDSFDSLLDSDIFNSQRVKIKNQVLYPILKDLLEKDINEQKMRNMIENEIRKSEEKWRDKNPKENNPEEWNKWDSQQSSQWDNEWWNKKWWNWSPAPDDDWMDPKNSKGWKTSDKQWEWSDDNISDDDFSDKIKEKIQEYKDKKKKWIQKEIEDKQKELEKTLNDNWWEDEKLPDEMSSWEDWLKDKEVHPKDLDTDDLTDEDIQNIIDELKQETQIQKKIQDEIDSMTDKQKKELQKQAIKAINDQNAEELKEERPDVDIPDNDDFYWENKENNNPADKQAESKKNKKDAKDEIIEQIKKAVEQREQDLDNQEKIENGINKKKLEAPSKRKFNKPWELENLENEINKISDQEMKDDLLKKIQEAQKTLEDQKKQYESALKDQWFDLSDEDDYLEFVQIEEEIEDDVQDFVKDLKKYIPNLHSYIYSGEYYSGTVYDMLKAAVKLRTRQYDVYGRKEEVPTGEIKLWIILSIDVSASMKDEMPQVLKLAIFLWLFCSKLNIPFHINWFWSWLVSVKDITDQYQSCKGNIMRMTKNLQSFTNIWVAVEDNLEVIQEQKHKYPDMVFLPIFLTDGNPNRWILGDELQQKIEEFEWLDIVFGIWLSEDDFEYTQGKSYFAGGKRILLDSSDEIMTQWKDELIEFFNDNKEKIFK